MEGIAIYLDLSKENICVHEIRHDKRCKYIETTCLDNSNQCERSYNSKTHMEKNKTITYEHYMDEEMESRDTHTYIKNHN